MTDKVKLKVKPQEKKKVMYNGVEIEVDSIMSSGKQAFLIKQYIEEYFADNPEPLISNSTYNYLEAEYNMMDYILQTCTNVDTEDLDADIYNDLTFWRKISESIENIDDFKHKLYRVVQDAKEKKAIENSIGEVVNNLVEKAYKILDKVSEISPEDISKLQDTGKELIEKLKESSVV